MKEAEYLKQQHQKFMKDLEAAGLSDCYGLFKYHAIYSMRSMRNRIKDENDIMNVIQTLMRLWIFGMNKTNLCN